MFKIGLKLEFFCPSPAKHVIWQNQKIWVMLKILLKFEIFDQPGLANHDIGNMIHIIQSFAKIWDFWPPRAHKTWNLAKSRNLSHIRNSTQIWDFCLPGSWKTWTFQKSKNLSHVENFAQIWDFWPPRTCKTKNLVIWVTFTIWLKFEIFVYPGPVNHEIWQN